MSVNQRRMKRMLRSWTSALTSSRVWGRSGMGRETSRPGRGVVGPTAKLGEPAFGPALELVHRRGELAPHLGELVLDADRAPGADGAAHDAVRFELLHALGQQAVRKLRDRLGDLTEAQHLAVDEDADDGAGPAAPDELDRLVVVGTAGGATAFAAHPGGPFRRRVCPPRRLPTLLRYRH